MKNWAEHDSEIKRTSSREPLGSLRSSLRAVLQGPRTLTWEQPRVRDFWEATVRDFTEELCIQNFRVTRISYGSDGF